MVGQPSSPIDPDTLLQHSFTSVRRGYDPLEVQKLLMAVAGELRAARDRQRDLERRLDEAERKVAELSEMSPARLTALLGEETARVLDAANAAADDIRAKAQENVARLVREGQEQAAKLRRDAELVLDRKTREAEEAAAAIVRKGEEALQQARAEAEQEVETGRQRGREMVNEAQRVRERMLRDLARRRKLLRQQIEQLQAGRDRLLEAYEVVRETVDTATAELDAAGPEARTAAEVAGQRFDEEAVSETLEQDLAELTAEVEAGLELRSGAPGDDAERGEADQLAAAERASTEGTEAAEAGDGERSGEGAAAPEEAEEEPARAAKSEDAGDELAGAGDGDEASTEAGGADGAPPSEAAVAGEVDASLPNRRAPDPVAGRHSSAVNVIRSDDEPERTDAKVASLFARIKQEAETPADSPAVPEPADHPTAEATPAADASAPGGSLEGGSGDARRRRAAELERALARRLKRELSDEQNEVLDAVRREKEVPAADDVLPDPEDHAERYANAALPVLADVAAARVELDDGSPPVASSEVRDVAADVAAEIVATLRERTTSSFAAAGDDADELTERLRAEYRGCRDQRIDALAHRAVARLLDDHAVTSS